ncbi:glycerate kinase family protein [Candidatus Mycobacterium methanotrophicum]|uniref:Glycerate kinase n=1 Tax=Candidatus Mycobacterium methanotrophicum TaxID=2943498 RepID=A0ABY4QS13_9MYCO|nr:glycerate kinase [Candidatus Mycobacterium methanotrophicum]UQX13117.1 glycerate kinase [Candidatus Mycobacterium methanotrophicum]
MRVLVAPDSYGDSLTAVEAAAAIAAGWNRARPDDRFTIAPQSDGGPGFVDVLAGRLGERRRLEVSGPLDDDVLAEWVLDTESATAYLECAQACGSARLGGPPTPQTALGAHSRGVGQLIAAALRSGAARIVVGLGGSASTDGGRGLVDELGGLAAGRQRLAGVELIAASDVEYPLLGPWGAAAIFGPQKGADADTVAALEQRLAEWAAELDAAAGRSVSAQAGAGAAGGIGAALLALGGRCESGASIIAERTGLANDIAAADLVITGEGRLDDQSLHGKVVGALAEAARSQQVPIVVMAGRVDLDRLASQSAGILAAYSIADYAGSARLALVDAANQLMGLASCVAARLGNSGTTRYL